MSGSGVPRRYQFTYDWFSAAPKVLGPLLAPLRDRPHVRFSEIGVYEGRATVWFLENVLTHPTCHIDCIDPFAWRWRDGRPGRVDMHAVKHRFEANIRATGRADQVTLIEERSDVALCALPPSTYDLIYVDGSHRAADVLCDAVLSFRLLRRDGLLVFDDYRLARSLGQRVSLDDPKPGIDAFLSIYARRLDIVWSGYQLVVRRRMPDPDETSSP